MKPRAGCQIDIMIMTTIWRRLGDSLERQVKDSAKYDTYTIRGRRELLCLENILENIIVRLCDYET